MSEKKYFELGKETEGTLVSLKLERGTVSLAYVSCEDGELLEYSNSNVLLDGAALLGLERVLRDELEVCPNCGLVREIGKVYCPHCEGVTR